MYKNHVGQGTGTQRRVAGRRRGGGAQDALPCRRHRGKSQREARLELREGFPTGRRLARSVGMPMWRNGAACRREERAKPGESKMRGIARSVITRGDAGGRLYGAEPQSTWRDTTKI